MLKSARPSFALGASAPQVIPRQRGLSRVTLEPSLRAAKLPGEPRTDIPFDIAGFGLVREFVEHLAARSQLPWATSSTRSTARIDWEALEDAVAGASSLELAIGRAIALADRMCRDVSDDHELEVTTTRDEVDEPFFAFSVTDVVPDFGDQSRYRARVAKRVAKIFGNRRQPDAVCGVIGPE